MYSDKLVVAVRANGKILREHKDLVYLPFGAEYSLLIKNKNSVRAKVRVEIDGQDATEGVSLIVPANGSIDLERFIKSGNLEQGNRFKFIERTKKIEDGPRGIGAEDGLIRVEFEFEHVTPVYRPQIGPSVYDTLLRNATFGQAQPMNVYYSSTPTAGSVGSGVTWGSITSSIATGATLSVASGSIAQNAALSQTFDSFQTADEAPKNDVGITVPGSVSDQKFETGSWFPTDGVKHVMILKLLGEVEGKVVEKPVTVKHKPTCVTCGTVNKANAKFCRECGTALSIV